ncbi:MAG TPA: 50S ribosome-binding GTPase [Candidatus Avimonoglobus intestinipullorum]|uniref:50S ribosome-binding GTPase n=1 Tax=Candidatus Avimonoglobus intestinipullorum TaxID=2840699 RepID=A0A9D1LW20_9FIRM|nr:50S ribosome-binding GTPase [Candidatus Avimonoglobus intestinipullorum]
MGLTKTATGLHAVDNGLVIKKISDADQVIALAGNPNVGKSTVFNELTGLKQHTGNWPGKTVSNAQGMCSHNNSNYVMVDIPGTYSLMAHSAEEEVARDFICFGDPDAVIVVCDATCLERNLNLVLQTLEITKNVVVCVNLMDEAKKKDIKIDLKHLSNKLGVPVVGAAARSGKGLRQMMQAVQDLLKAETRDPVMQIRYIQPIEDALALLEPPIREKIPDCRINPRWIALRLLDYEKTLYNSLTDYLGFDLLSDAAVADALKKARCILQDNGLTGEELKDRIVSCIVMNAEDTANGVIDFDKKTYNARDMKIDRILTNKWTGYPIMIALLGIVFWLTITGANYPSKLLSDCLFWVEDRLVELAVWAGVPAFFYEMLIFGMYRVLAWVVSVMLPPMAIFFPLFTLLEDLGYLPRIAFNLDKAFKKCCACGKQALTM